MPLTDLAPIVKFKKIGSGSLGPGKMERTVVNGVKPGRVWMFSAEAVFTGEPGALLPGEDGSIEVTRVRHVFNPQTDKRQIMVTVKNSGKSETYEYELYMAVVKPY